MDSYLGDLADIVRATTTTTSTTTTSISGFNNPISSPSITVTTSTTIDNDHRRRRRRHHHQPPAAADWTGFHANSTSSMEFSPPRAINQHPSSILSHDGDFGDPFSNTRDPLLGIGTEFDAIGPTTTTLHHSTAFFSHHEHNNTCAASAAASDVNMDIAAGGGGLSGGSCRTTEVDGKQQEMAAADEDMKMTTTCSDSNHTNIFSRILQISPSPNKLIPIPNSYAPAAASAITTPSANRRSCTTNNVSASTALPPAVATTAAAAAAVGFMSINSDMINNDNNNNPIGNCTTTPAAGATAALQISSPRNPGIKRRKSQAKKVVCIPAPAATNTRQGGEVVPSDLWAWRKYGQKPIKGSPYPRGYYRCSSSKGCSARKQVERSKTDPNMLVITYTSEHNHPWPTQRNALAGSTRTGQSSSSKNTSTAGVGNAPASTKPSEINACASVKQGNNRDGIGEDTVNENNDNNNNNHPIDLDMERMDVMMIGSNSSRLINATTGDRYLVKEEVMLSCVNKGGDDDDGHQMKGGGENEGHREGLQHRHLLGDQLLVDGSDNLYSSYRPIMPDDQCNYLLKQQLEDPQDSFFADLGELEADPLTLLFRGGGGDDDHRDGNNAAAVAAALLDNDPFSGMFDWVAVHNNDGSSSSSRKQL